MLLSLSIERVRPLLTLIRNLTPPDSDHEGDAQEVFLAVFRSLASFDPKRSAFSTWLFTIAAIAAATEWASRSVLDRLVALIARPDFNDCLTNSMPRHPEDA